MNHSIILISILLFSSVLSEEYTVTVGDQPSQVTQELASLDLQVRMGKVEVSIENQDNKVLSWALKVLLYPPRTLTNLVATREDLFPGERSQHPP